MAPRKAVGRVYIRALPDTSGFRQQLRRELETIRRRESALVDVDGDLTRLRNSLRQLERTSSVTVRINADAAAFRAQIEAAASRVRVELDVGGNFARLKAQVAALRLRLDLDVGANTTRARREIDDLTRDRIIRIRADVDRTTISRISGLFGTAGRGLSVVLPSLSGLTGLLTLTAKTTAGITALTMGISGLTSLMGGLVGVVGNLAGGFAVLPAVVLGGAAALGVLGIAFSNFTTATGAAADVKAAFLSMETGVKDLRQSVQDNLFKNLSDPIRLLGSNYIPVFKKGLSGIAEEMGRTARAAVAFLNLPKTVQDTATGLDNARGFGVGLTKAIGPALQALRDLAVVGSEFLPRMGDAIGNAAQRFADFIAAARDDGRITGWIQTATDSFRALGRILGNVGSAFGSLFDAAGASGTGFLGTLEKVTAGFAGLMANPKVQAGLTAFFTGAHAAAATLTGALGDTLPRLLAALGPAFSSVAQSFSNVLAAAIRTVGPVLAQLAPQFSDMVSGLSNVFAPIIASAGPALSRVGTVFVTLAKSVGEVFGAALRQVIPLVEKLAPVFAALAATLGTAFVSAIDTLGPALDALANVFVTLGPLIGGLAATVIPLLAEGFNTFAPIIADVAERVMPALITVLQGIAPVILDLFIVAAPIITSLGELFVALLPVIQGAVAFLAPIIEAALNAVKFVIDVITAVITGDWTTVWEQIKNVLNLVWEGIKALIALALAAVAAELSRVWENIKTAAANAWAWVKDKIKELLQAAWDWVTGTFSGIIDGIASIWNSIVTGVATFLGPVFAAILKPFQQAWAWIDTTFNDIIDSVSGIWKSIVTGVATFLGGVLDAVKKPFQAAWDWVRNVFGPGVVAAAKGIWQDIQDVFSKPLNTGLLNLDAQSGLPGVPGAAHGAVVNPQPGGSLWNVGEAGKREVIAPEPLLRSLQMESERRLMAMIRASSAGAGGAQYTINVDHSGPGTLVPEAVVNALKDWERTHG